MIGFSLGAGVELRQNSKRPEEYSTNCPWCAINGKTPDTKFHLGLNTQKLVFQCFRCGETGGFKKLRQFFQTGDVSTYQPTGDLNKLRARLSGLTHLRDPIDFDLDKISWPIDAKECPMGRDYMAKRGFTIDEMKALNLRVGFTYKDKVDGVDRMIRRWDGRILFPFYERKSVVFVVGRAYGDQDPKYLNSVGSKDHVVYGIDEVVDECIVCEGIVSKIAAQRSTGVPSVSILGKSATRFQISKIRSKAKRVFVCLDGTEDVTRDQRNRLNRQFILSGCEVWEVMLPLGADPDDLKARFAKHFARAKRVTI